MQETGGSGVWGLWMLVCPCSLGCLPFIRGWAPKPLMLEEWVRNVECQPSGHGDVCQALRAL